MINIGVYYTLDTEGRTLSYQGTKEKVLGFTEFNTLSNS